MLRVTPIAATAGGLVAPAVHLVGPQNMVGRQLANAVVLPGASGAYRAGAWRVGVPGYLLGGGLLAVVVLVSARAPGSRRNMDTSDSSRASTHRWRRRA